ncbi:MAG: hypothetical protein K1X83_04155 [Oligoflexia bacterium]|nr:hypothetical protein [Oligoflexia bacterium]
MTTRVSELQISRNLVNQIAQNRAQVDKYSNEISSGVKVDSPGDSNFSGTIAQYQDTLAKLGAYKNRISFVQGFLEFQDNAVTQVGDLLTRAKEIAEQGANGSISSQARSELAPEVFQLRDQLVALANSTYQGRYVWGGADDDDPPYDPQTYTNYGSTASSQRYTFDNEAGTAIQRTINIGQDLDVTINTPANDVFDRAIQGLERLGRALEGYDTQPASGAPTGAGGAYTFPADYTNQTNAIKSAMDLMDTARKNDVVPEQVSIGARLKRLDTATSLIELTENSSKEVLSKLQDADYTDSISNLNLAQTALQAAMTVTSRVLSQSILDYI